MTRILNSYTIKTVKKSIISIDVTTGSYQTFLDKILSLCAESKSCYICVANVHMLVEAYNDPSFASIVNNAEITTPDGMPLAYSLKLLYNINQDRVAGMDLLPDLLTLTQKSKTPIYFYGGTQEMILETEQFVRRNYPESIIAGLHSPPFRSLTSEEENEIVLRINNSGAKLLLVALGCPKQEKWMASMQGRINMPMIGIGGALPVLVGLQRRAPVWAQKAGLEWLFRLLQEPRRLFKRYAVTNTTFLLLLFKAKFLKVISGAST